MELVERKRKGERVEKVIERKILGKISLLFFVWFHKKMRKNIIFTLFDFRRKRK